MILLFDIDLEVLGKVIKVNMRKLKYVCLYLYIWERLLNMRKVKVKIICRMVFWVLFEIYLKKR